MLCDLCQKFAVDILSRDFSTWRKVNDTGLHTFRHGDHHEIQATAAAGCRVCGLLSSVRQKRMPAYSELGEKWLRKSASIDVVWEGDAACIPSLKLVTVAPEQRSIEFEFFALRACDGSQTGFPDALACLPGHIATKPMESMPLARRWLRACQSSHEKDGSCASTTMQRLPTRVLDVGPADGWIEPKLHLSADDERDHYVTLSHCWGKTERLVTTEANIDRHFQCISMASLPSTFHDAVIVTRCLGYRYLWIDALCIIQNSEIDWQHAAQRMHHVFANATLSISALDAIDSHAGFLGDREQEHVEISFDDCTVGLRPKPLSSAEGITTSVLDTRAWCLQERLLPSRVLYFGREQLYWRCRASQASEATRDLTTQGPAYRPQVLKLIREDDADVRQDAWLDVLTQYSERLVTVPKDRVPALYGLGSYAELASRSFWLWYGMPLEGIHKSLLWRRTPWYDKAASTPGQRFVRRTSTFRTDLMRRAEQAEGNEDQAPSWSWACLNKPVNWTWRYNLQERVNCGLDTEIDLDNQLHKPPSEPFEPDASMPERFGHDWMLSCRGHVRRGNCKIAQDPDAGNSTASFSAPSTQRGRKIELACSLDHPPTFTSNSCYALYITSYSPAMPAAVSRTSTGLSTSSTNSDRARKKKSQAIISDQAFVLLLERTEPPRPSPLGTYRRIGLAQGAAQEVQRMFKDTPRSSLVIW